MTHALSHTSNHDTHWYRCRTCGGVSWDSDTAALAGKTHLTERDVTHDPYCPGRTFTDKHVGRITHTY